MGEASEGCKTCGDGRSSFGLLSYIRAKTSGYARVQTQQARMVMCQLCQETNREGEKLFREFSPDYSYCGTPRKAVELRDEWAEGCGCHLQDKVRWRKSACPRNLWVEEGEEDSGLRGNSTVVNGKIRIYAAGHVARAASKDVAKLSNASDSVLPQTKLVRLEANGIGDLCVAACVAAGVKAKEPDRYVALGVRAHLLPFAEMFKDADFVFGTHELDDSRFGWACYPDLGKTLHEFPTRGKEGWVENSCRLCEAEFRIPKIDVPVEGQQWFENQEALKRRPIVVLSPFAAYQNRHWPMHRWLELEVKLGELGWNVVTVDGPGDGERLKKFRGVRFWGLSPWNLFALVRAADMVIGNDSGIAHVAGVFQRPTIAVMGPTNGPSTFTHYRTVRWIHGKTECQSCYWQRDAGFRDACAEACDSLWTISVQDVLEEVRRVQKG